MIAARGLSSPRMLVLPAAALIVVFVVMPYLNIMVMSLRTPAQGNPYGEGFTLQSYLTILTDAYYYEAVLKTLRLGVVTSITTLALGLPLALHINRAGRRMRGLLIALVLSPLLVGIVVRSYGWTILLGNAGIVNSTLRDLGLIDRPLPLMYNELGIIIGLTHVFLPFMILPILSALQSIDPAVSAAARSLGARPFTVFRRVTLPLALPGIRSGTILVFVLAVSAYVTPALMGGMRIQTATLMTVDILIDQYRWPFGSALALTLSIAAALMIVAFGRMTRTRWTQ
jgi:putative spermidine/putrescine transport system permease protein